MTKNLSTQTAGHLALPEGRECFYVNVDVSNGWPYEETEPLCKFGVTVAHPEWRCWENQQVLRRKWDIDATLEVCFCATGVITTIEKELADSTLPWLLEDFGQQAEWRRCDPRQLARLAIFLAERRARSPLVESPSEGSSGEEDPDKGLPNACAQEINPRGEGGEDRNVEGIGLLVSGSMIYCEPMPTARENSPEGEGSPDKRDSCKEDTLQVGTPRSVARPLREPRPDCGPDGTGVWAGEVAAKLGQSHRCLRLRNFFAERRFCIRAKKESSSNEESSKRGSFRNVPSRDDSISVRISPIQRRLLGETLAQSRYRTRSSYLRAVGTGQDRSAPVVAKSGIVLFWTLRHLGGEVGAEEQEELRRLLGLFFQVCGAEEALGLARRHLLARRLWATGSAVSEEDLPPPPGPTSSQRQSTGTSESGPSRPRSTGLEGGAGRGLNGSTASSSVSVSFRLSRERKEILEENVCQSDYGSTSAYLRQLALGRDRALSACRRCETVIRWMEDRLGTSFQAGNWAQLEDLFWDRSGALLLGEDGQKDPDRVLRQGVEHLLGTSLETISQETGIPL